MEDKEQWRVPTGLYHAELGKMVMEYVGRIHPTVIENAMESRAIRTLEAIRQVLEDDSYGDPECVQQVDDLIQLFFQELDIKIERQKDRNINKLQKRALKGAPL